MPDHVFKVRPQSAQCREAICLEDYEAAWQEHQHIQFERIRREAAAWQIDGQYLGRDFEKFRTQVWGSSSYADGMKVRIHSGRQELTFSWNDIAVGGSIEYSDVQGLMGLGVVEFLLPSHRCVSSRIGPNWEHFPIRNRRDFQAMVQEMQNLTPLHREGMGNAFWPLCLPDAVESPLPPVSPAAPDPLALAVNEADPCHGGEVDYYDEDRGQAVCEEDSTMGGTLKAGMGNMITASIGLGMHFALAAVVSHRLGTSILSEE